MQRRTKDKIPYGKKKAGRKKKGKTGKKKIRKTNLSLKTDLLKAFAGITFLLLLVLTTGILVHFLLPQKEPVEPALKQYNKKQHSKKQDTKNQEIHKKPTYEIYPKKDIPRSGRTIRSKIPKYGKKPKVAIIIDDIGYDRTLAEKFLNLEAALTFSMLPKSPHYKQIAHAANKQGLEVMLHLPMEPVEYPGVDPGPGSLLISMSPDLLINQLNEDLDSMPFIIGVNNHMGSKMTTISTQMYQIFSILKKRDLFFIDSRTTSETLCKPSARLLKLPFAERDIFLDNIQEPSAVRRQLKQLIKIANEHGMAVGIGHPYTVTYDILKGALPDLKKKVRLVPASKVVTIIGS
jgi:polysaccharide deacetylase 2 family uncharacterized protein YibQ